MSNTWIDRAACADPEVPLDLFFATDPLKKYQARAMCTGLCSVRLECLQHALDQPEIHGIWGGVDDYELRRALSVDKDGRPVKRSRLPRCPGCGTKREELEVIEKKRNRIKVKCPKDGLVWEIRRG